MDKHQVTKKFTTGVLAGIVVVETTSTSFPIGFEAKKSRITPSAYVVIDCRKVAA